MGNELIGVLSFAVLFALIFLGMPIGFATTLVAFVGMVIVGGFPAAMGMFSTAPFSIVAHYSLCTIPLFVLMGSFAFISGAMSDGYEAAYKFLGRLRGGLAISTIGACAGLAACTGSSAASVSVMTISALPEMEKRKYSLALASGSIASGCTLGILIPPSIPLIVYGLFAEQSIGQLFIAGIIPGLLLTVLFIVVIMVWTSLRPSDGPPATSTTRREKIDALKKIWSMLLLIGIVLGGIWGGVFSPVEAGGIGAFGAFMIALFRRRITKEKLIESLISAAKMNAMVFILMIGALLFNYFLAMTRLPYNLAEAITSLQVSPMIIVIAIMFFWLIGGCIMDVLGLMMLTLPIFIPIVDKLGINLIWFGILQVIMVEAAEITPPIGVNVFMLSGMAKHIPMSTIFRGIFPFLISLLLCLILLLLFPQIALFLPETMMK
ncbi:MAG: TRAP transporter large permease [Deltaproteobacteria bacterium]|nr:TRAP transporter large permease [Deltaproteobacteria bacterium]